MAKSTRSSSRRRSSAGSRKRSRPARRARAPRIIKLKPLYNQIGRVLKQLEQLQKRQAAGGPERVALAEPVVAGEDSVSRAIARLTQHRQDFADICGSTMAIPAP